MNQISSTIDKLHNDKIIYLEKKKKKEQKKKNILKGLYKKLDKLENSKNKNYDNYLIHKTKITDVITEIENELKLGESYYDELNYWDKSIDILVDYYDIIDNNKNNNKILNMDDIFNTKVVDNTKSDLYNKYLKNTKNINIKKDNNLRTCKNNNCKNKDLTLHISDGYFSCMNCGYSEELIIEGDKTSYKELSNENSVYAYKRINHFNEWLSQFQGKESTDIPDILYKRILLELKKERVNDIEDIDIMKMRKILKNLGYNKYYEHIPHILTKIGKSPPKLTREIEEELRYMFKQIQEPFSIHCPKNRKNFLSYSYTLHKFCELLGLDDIAKLFPMLKSREKLKEQDILWRDICKHLKWEYIPSI